MYDKAFVDLIRKCECWEVLCCDVTLEVTFVYRIFSCTQI